MTEGRLVLETRQPETRQVLGQWQADVLGQQGVQGRYLGGAGRPGRREDRRHEPGKGGRVAGGAAVAAGREAASCLEQVRVQGQLVHTCGQIREILG